MTRSDGQVRCRLPVPAGSLEAGRRTVDGDDYRYLFRARRLPRGAAIELFDGAGLRARATVVEVAGGRAVLEVAAPEAAPVESPIEVELIMALIKGERMDWCVQKAVELGVARVVPALAARSVVRLEGRRADNRRERLQSVAVDAARQCGRAVVPEVGAVVALDDAIEQCRAATRLVCDESDRSRGLRDALGSGLAAPIAVLVGPEGGFASGELAAAHRAGFVSVGLGPRILRAETAAIAALAALQLTCGDLGQAI